MTVGDATAGPGVVATSELDLDGAVTSAHDAYRAARPRSAAADERARVVLPGGNTRSVLDFRPFPFRVVRAEGAEIVDLDGHRYVDLCGNFTAGLLGHSPTPVREAVVAALDRGWAVGATHELEIELAELVCEGFASIDQVRFTNSGTEANLMAMGTALHVTDRAGVGVFERAYHGGVLSFGPDTSGPHHPLNVPHEFHVAPFDDVSALDELFAHDLACVLVEPVQGSGGCRPASVEFLRQLRRRCDESGTLLVLDEVMTSRLAPGGAQELFDVRPDVTTLGKYLGGGLPFGAFGGRVEVMAAFDPAAGGTLTQAGTFNNDVVSTAAAVATLRHELDHDRLVELNARGDRLRRALSRAFEPTAGAMTVTGLGSMNCVHADDDRLLELWFHAMVDDGWFVARRGFMALSFEITDDHVDEFVESTTRWVDGFS